MYYTVMYLTMLYWRNLVLTNSSPFASRPFVLHLIPSTAGNCNSHESKGRLYTFHSHPCSQGRCCKDPLEPVLHTRHNPDTTHLTLKSPRHSLAPRAGPTSGEPFQCTWNCSRFVLASSGNSTSPEEEYGTDQLEEGRAVSLFSPWRMSQGRSPRDTLLYYVSRIYGGLRPPTDSSCRGPPDMWG